MVGPCFERGIAVRQGLHFLRAELPGILASHTDLLSPRMVRVIEELADDWRRLDERIEGLSAEIEAEARKDVGCERLMSVPGHRSDHLQCDGRCDRHRRRILEGTLLRRLARACTAANLRWRSHDPGQDRNAAIVICGFRSCRAPGSF
jgi:hypothetical protein